MQRSAVQKVHKIPFNILVGGVDDFRPLVYLVKPHDLLIGQHGGVMSKPAERSAFSRQSQHALTVIAQHTTGVPAATMAPSPSVTICNLCQLWFHMFTSNVI